MSATGSISVIVCTHGDHARSLERLIAALSWQTVPFELVVVAGPATPATRAVIDRLPDAARRVACDTLNINRARNLGIASAGGDIVVFIDQDAAPVASDWLARLVAPLARVGAANGTVAAVGGAVYRGNTDVIELARGASSPQGAPRVDDGGDDPMSDGATWVPRLPGGNCAMSRRALENVGGFDEQLALSVDETDLCVRLAAVRYRIAYAADARVRRFPAAADGPAGLRPPYPAARSDAYLVMRHGGGALWRRILQAIREHRSRRAIVERRAQGTGGQLSSTSLIAVRLKGWLGLASGIATAMTRGPRLTPGGTPRARASQPFELKRILILTPQPVAEGTTSDAVASWATSLQRAAPAVSVTVVSEQLGEVRSGGVLTMSAVPADTGGTLETPTLPRLARAAGEAARWVSVLRELYGHRSPDLVVWPGPADIGVLIEDGLGRHVALVAIADAGPTPPAAALDEMADRCAALVGASDVRLTTPAQVVSQLQEGWPASRPAPRPPLASAMAATGIVRGLTTSLPGATAPSTLDADQAEAVLATVRHCVRDGHHELAADLGAALRGRTDETRVLVELDYHVAGALRELGRVDASRELYEAVRQADDRRGELAPFRAGACFHLAVDARAADQTRRAMRLLGDCLALLPTHRGARQLLDEIDAVGR